MKNKSIMGLMVFLLTTSISYGWSFKFFSRPNYEIKDYGSYKAFSNGKYARTCKEYLNPINVRYRYKGSIGDGTYRISPDGVNYIDVSCRMGEGGWTVISSGGNACGGNTLIAKGAGGKIEHNIGGLADSSNCGYMVDSYVRMIAQLSNDVMLIGVGSKFATHVQLSTGTKAIEALRNGGNWHNGASGEFVGNWDWSYSCASTATSWPNMYHACGNGGGVHWLLGSYYFSSVGSGPINGSSTWVR